MTAAAGIAKGTRPEEEQQYGTTAPQILAQMEQIADNVRSLNIFAVHR
jgi:hypothetical protein